MEEPISLLYDALNCPAEPAGVHGFIVSLLDAVCRTGRVRGTVLAGALENDDLRALVDAGACAAAPAFRGFRGRIEDFHPRGRLAGRLARLAGQRPAPDDVVSAHTEAADVYHANEYGFFRKRGAVNVATVFDLTTLLFPPFHEEENIRHHAAKTAWVRAAADQVVCISESTRQDVVRLLGVPEERTHVVPGAAHADFAGGPAPPGEQARVRAKLGLGARPFLLAAGTIEPRKNLRGALAVFRALTADAARAPADLALVLAGKTGWKAESFLREVEDAKDRGDVVLAGYVPRADLRALYSAAACFLYLSFYEGFGLPPLEAMACGAPVVASDRGSLPEVVGAGGVLVDPDDPPAALAAVRAILGDPARARELRARAVEQAGRFSWDRSASRLVDLYERWIAAAGGSPT